MTLLSFISQGFPPLIGLCVLFPGLFTVMKRMRRTQMLMCTSPLHLLIKTWRLKASLCFGSSSLICPALVANLRPLQRLVLWAYKIYNDRVVHVTHLKICVVLSCFAGNWAKAFPELESQNNMRPTSPVHGAHLFVNAIWTYPDWEPWWQNRVVPNSEKQPGYAWRKGKKKNIPGATGAGPQVQSSTYRITCWILVMYCGWTDCLFNS